VLRAQLHRSSQAGFFTFTQLRPPAQLVPARRALRDDDFEAEAEAAAVAEHGHPPWLAIGVISEAEDYR
jgi:hypothetical protein